MGRPYLTDLTGCRSRLDRIQHAMARDRVVEGAKPLPPNSDSSPSSYSMSSENVLAIEGHRVGHARVNAELTEQGRKLPAMMRLVVEKVNEGGAQWVSKFVPGIILVTERRIEALWRDSDDELLDLTISLGALAPELVEIGI